LINQPEKEITRINCGVDPSELTDKHLLAEHREIKRIPNCVAKGRFSLKGQPKQFTLGAGHVKFFYDKQRFLLNRYQKLHEECIQRGFAVSDFSSAWDNVPSNLMGDYQPSLRDREIVLQRINERLEQSNV
jgi:hypothetical protein